LRQAYDYWQDQPGNYRQNVVPKHNTTSNNASVVF
jgi:hypothetical protein